MNLIRSFPILFAVSGLAAQSPAIFPAEYTAVTEGPLNSPNLPLAFGTSRVLVVYDHEDLTVPVGAAITQLGFRQDATLTTKDTGRALQLEVRMGYTNNSATAPSTTFDSNYDGAPTTVFGPALFTLPDLRDAQNPLPNGQFFVTLATPFLYQPNGRNLLVDYRVFGNSGGGTSFNYRLDRADYYSPVNSGAPGCAHSGGGVPQLTASPVRIGASLTLNGSNGPANSFGICIVNVGANLAAPYPLQALFAGVSATCTGQIAPGNLAILSTTTGSTGSWSLSYAVPNTPALNDLWLSHQSLLLDAFAPGGLVVSNGVEVQIGIKPQASIVAAQGPPTTTVGSLNANYCPVSFFVYQ